MGDCVKIRTAETLVGQSVVLMDRVQDLGDEDTAPDNIQQADISTITYTIKRGGTSIASSTLDKTDVVFDSLKTAGGWDTSEDSTGFNFRWTVPGSSFASEGEYNINITFTDTNDNTFVVAWVVTAEANGR